MFTQIREITPTQLLQAGQGGTISGPLTDLDNSSLNYDLYKYPMKSVEENQPDKGHEIIFYVNIPTTSYWSNGEDAQNNAQQPIANRLSDPTRFGLRNADDATFGDSVGSTLSYLGSSVPNQIMKRKTKRTSTAISLYVPNVIDYDQNMLYKEVNMTETLGTIGDAGALLNSLAHGDGRVAGGAFASMVPDVSKFFGNRLPGINTLDDNVLAALGLADNPMNYLMFKQINFRKFQFDFLLVPENSQDSQIINQIIYLFRFHSAPEIAEGSLGRFFIPPSDFDIDILHNGQVNTRLPKISTCVCNDVHVQYGAHGHWSTMYDGQPSVVRLSLSMTETEIMTKDRIQQGF
jgi:hypothetical protein